MQQDNEAFANVIQSTLTHHLKNPFLTPSGKYKENLTKNRLTVSTTQVDKDRPSKKSEHFFQSKILNEDPSSFKHITYQETPISINEEFFEKNGEPGGLETTPTSNNKNKNSALNSIPKIQICDMNNGCQEKEEEEKDEIKNENIFSKANKINTTISNNIYRMISLSLKITDEMCKDFFLMKDLPETSKEEISEKRIGLPPPKNKITSNKTLFLDLDDTLIHAFPAGFKQLQKSCKDFDVQSVSYVDSKKKKRVNIQFLIRPFAIQFLKDVSKHYEIILFTASDQPYADSIIEVIDPDGVYIEKKLYRESCILKGKTSIKNLNIIKNRDLTNMIIVDNSIASFKDNLPNGIYIPTFIDKAEDREMIHLSDFLLSISKVNDVRDSIRDKFRIERMFKMFLQSQS